MKFTQMEEERRGRIFVIGGEPGQSDWLVNQLGLCFGCDTLYQHLFDQWLGFDFKRKFPEDKCEFPAQQFATPEELDYIFSQSDADGDDYIKGDASCSRIIKAMGIRARAEFHRRSDFFISNASGLEALLELVSLCRFFEQSSKTIEEREEWKAQYEKLTPRITRWVDEERPDVIVQLRSRIHEQDASSAEFRASEIRRLNGIVMAAVHGGWRHTGQACKFFEYQLPPTPEESAEILQLIQEEVGMAHPCKAISAAIAETADKRMMEKMERLSIVPMKPEPDFTQMNPAQLQAYTKHVAAESRSPYGEATETVLPSESQLPSMRAANKEKRPASTAD